MGVKENLIHYMEQKRIQPEGVAKEAGISQAKLVPGSKEELTASEFCEICFLLQVNPYRIYHPETDYLWENNPEEDNPGDKGT